MGGLRARPARPRMRPVERPDVAGPDRLSEAEIATGLRIFGEAVAEVAREHGEVLESARAGGAITGVEEAV